MNVVPSAWAAETGAQAKSGHEYVDVQATMSKHIRVIDAETFAIAGLDRRLYR
jgi:hypothetical protein